MQINCQELVITTDRNRKNETLDQQFIKKIIMYKKWEQPQEQVALKKWKITSVLLKS